MQSMIEASLWKVSVHAEQSVIYYTAASFSFTAKCSSPRFEGGGIKLTVDCQWQGLQLLFTH